MKNLIVKKTECRKFKPGEKVIASYSGMGGTIVKHSAVIVDYIGGDPYDPTYLVNIAGIRIHVVESQLRYHSPNDTLFV